MTTANFMATPPKLALICIEMESFEGRKRKGKTSNRKEEKKRRWEAKQARKLEDLELEKSRTKWFQENADYATVISDEDVAQVTDTSNAIDDQDKNRKRSLLLPYLNVQDTKASNRTGGTSGEQLFIAEGTETVRLLIQQLHVPRADGLAPIELRSIFLKPSVLFQPPVSLISDVDAARQRRNGSPNNPGFDVLVGSERALSNVAGFPIARGALACGVISTDRNEEWLSEFVRNRLAGDGPHQLRILAMDGICDTSNLGSMVRSASAFGVDAVVLSKDTCDGWYRRSIRVSMGHLFKVPVVRVRDLSALLRTWKVSYPQLCSFAAVIDTDNWLENIKKGKVPNTWCCVVGNEGNGISREVADSCSQRIRIHMSAGVDSLSVPIACGILLHGLKERETS